MSRRRRRKEKVPLIDLRAPHGEFCVLGAGLGQLQRILCRSAPRQEMRRSNKISDSGRVDEEEGDRPRPRQRQWVRRTRQMKVSDSIQWVEMKAGAATTGSSKINGAMFSDTCSVRANWLCMGWPFCLAEMRRQFQTGGNLFCTTLYTVRPKING